MGFFKRLLRREFSLPPWGAGRHVLRGPRRRHGGCRESHYQKALRTCYEQFSEGRVANVVAILQPQPDNEYDLNAVAVHTMAGSVGHLSKADAKRWQSRIIEAWRREGKPVAVNGRIRTGSKNLYGMIWLDWPHEFD